MILHALNNANLELLINDIIITCEAAELVECAIIHSEERYVTLYTLNSPFAIAHYNITDGLIEQYVAGEWTAAEETFSDSITDFCFAALDA